MSLWGPLERAYDLEQPKEYVLVMGSIGLIVSLGLSVTVLLRRGPFLNNFFQWCWRPPSPTAIWAETNVVRNLYRVIACELRFSLGNRRGKEIC